MVILSCSLAPTDSRWVAADQEWVGEMKEGECFLSHKGKPEARQVMYTVLYNEHTYRGEQNDPGRDVT